MVGQRLLHYEILEKLGEGGMGVVYKARDIRLGRLVAIKVLPPESTGDSDRRHRFMQEARAASSLNHANIVTIYDIAEAAGVHFIAMEYIAGKTLHEVIGRRGLELTDTLNYAIQITDALSKAHAAGLVHRDLKPANIMVIDGQIKILDFGLAKLTEPAIAEASLTAETETLPITRHGEVVGTAAYMSPEQAEGKPVDARSDIFSLGAVLYEMTTGRRAFTGDSQASVLAAILRDEPAPVSEVASQVPRDLEKIISRCLRKEPGRRFQHILDIKLAIEDVKQESDTGTRAVSRSPSGLSRRVWIGGAVAGLLVIAAALGLGFWLLPRLRTTPAVHTPIRLTSDSGISDYPALSPDGKLLAYASDRAGQSNLDLWIKQVPSGEPVRLTHQAADEYDPSFSPDGTRVVYRSEQDGGGIYVIPALGGDPRLLAKRGRSPRFSPDGTEILYRMTSSADSLGGKVFVIPSNGGAERQILGQYVVGYSPIWTPTGKHVLFWGSDSRDTPMESFDWWVAPLTGGAAIKTGAFQIFKNQHLTVSVPGFWVPGEDRILFGGAAASNANIWQIPISRGTWKVSTSPRQVTFGSSDEVSVSVATGGGLAFSASVMNSDVWAAPLDANNGTVTGELRRLTQDAAYDDTPSVSADGSKVVFRSNRGPDPIAKTNVWLKDIASGREQQLTFTGDAGFFPVITADGSKVAYPRFQNDRVEIYAASVDGGAPEKICEKCGTPRGWSPDQRNIICQRDGSLFLLDVAARTGTEFLRHASANLYAAQFSPDGKWIAFGARFKPGDERLFIVPFGNVTIPQDETKWIAVTSGPALDNKPRWSPDGNLLYFTSDRDEFNCVWAQRLNPVTKRPVGEVFSVLHLHGAMRSFASSGSLKLEISVARDKLVFHLEEARANIWMTQLPKD